MPLLRSYIIVGNKTNLHISGIKNYTERLETEIEFDQQNLKLHALLTSVHSVCIIQSKVSSSCEDGQKRKESVYSNIPNQLQTNYAAARCHYSLDAMKVNEAIAIV